MKKLYLVVAGLCLLGLAAPSPLYAKGGKNKGGAPTSVPSDVYAKYDKNSNGALEAEEKEAIRKDFEADKNGPLKACDTTGDGKLSDDEIAAVSATKPSPPKEKKRKKKNQ